MRKIAQRGVPFFLPGDCPYALIFFAPTKLNQLTVAQVVKFRGGVQIDVLINCSCVLPFYLLVRQLATHQSAAYILSLAHRHNENSLDG